MTDPDRAATAARPTAPPAITSILLLIGVTSTAFLLPYRLGGIGPLDPGISGFRLWAMAPYSLLLLALWSRRESTWSQWTTLVGTILVVGSGVAVTSDAFMASPSSSTEALIMIFLPFYQGVGAMITLIVALLVGRRTSRRR